MSDLRETYNGDWPWPLRESRQTKPCEHLEHWPGLWGPWRLVLDKDLAKRARLREQYGGRA